MIEIKSISHAPMADKVSQFTGFGTSSARPDAPPSDLTLDSFTEPKSGQEYIVFHMAIVNPENIIDLAVNDPDKLRKGMIPFGIWKPLYMGTLEQCKKYEKKLIDAGKFDSLSRAKTGYYYNIIATDESRSKVAKEFVESKSREIMYKEKVKSNTRFAHDRNSAMKRFEEASAYEARMEDADDVMHYAQVKCNEHFVRSNLTKATEAMSRCNTSITGIDSKLSDIDSKHPEFKDTWRPEFDRYCTENGITNPFAANPDDR